MKVVESVNFPMNKITIKNRFRKDMGDVDEMAESLSERGQLQAIVVLENGELVIGERRVRAAQKLEWPTIRADVVQVNDKIEKMEMELDENVRRKSMTWQEVAMLEKAIFDMKSDKNPKWSQRKQAEMRGTAVSGVNMRIQLAEAMELIPELGECETQDEAWKEYKKLEEAAAVHHMRERVPESIKQAPKWAADHFMVGDALYEMERQPGAKFDFAEIDPPYAIDLVARKSRNEDTGPDDEYNEIDEDEYPAFFETAATEVFRVLKQHSFAVFWYGLQHHCLVYDTLTRIGFAVNPIPAIWYKGTVGQTAQPDIALASCYEPFFLARKGQPRMFRQGRSNVFPFQPLAPSRKIHRTERPQELMQEILGTILFPGSEILVPFLGSGATLRAAYKLGHTGLGWDLSAKNKQRFLKRVMEEFGDDAI
jgi:ParB family chromosome partitioning protein